ncbi:GNAT family N-acetyltransferase [Chitinophaga tropicalis]|uniref:GNAT family N-acetyltransferase n=1 Tax=Chitinophaga tropicalis TaxID=2683588 RepID=A0A7K1U4M8_9BACT|nr:GNAT family N-acetyltransferase [Chitinophaga tropicalis]MVT09300.1 GNAT family N-acetyltransferase [Chitinophaga tropicalis]
MEKVSISRVTLTDIDVLQTIGKQTFIETFAPHNSEQNMTRYLEDGFSRQKLTDEINTDGSVFYFAQLEGRVIGYLKINTGAAQTEIQDSNALEIERIYVVQEYHGRKVGQLLYEWAIQIAYERKFDYVWLGVWEHNTKAIRFYEKNGFVPFDKHVFILGDDEQTDIMMKKSLK